MRKPCCKAFTQIANKFGWFAMSDDVFKKTLCMPYFLGTEPLLRVNFCPSCGVNIRDIQLTPKQVGI